MMLAPTPRIVAIVPLRAGSKGLPGKNVRLLAGKPLYAHTVDHARIAGLSEVVISTDIGSLIGADLGPNVHVASRPAELARDDTQMAQVLSNLLSTTIKGPATIVLLQATSPLRDPSHINRAIAAFSEGNHDLVMSVTPANSSILKWGTVQDGRFAPISNPKYCFSNRAELPEVFRPDGAIYVFDADWFRKNRTLETSNIGVIVTPSWRARDIDTLEDFEAAEGILKRT